MSTEPGYAGVVADIVAAAKATLDAEQAEGEQLSLLDTVTPEEMLEARDALGGTAGPIAVLAEARKRKRGRPVNARNKRTDDFARYILSFGQDPAITLMQIQSTPPEVLIEASRQEKVHSFQRDGTPNVVIERMSYEAAQSLRKQCAAELMPFVHSKKPLAIDATIRGVRVVEEIGEPRRVGATIEGEVMRVARAQDDAGDGA